MAIKCPKCEFENPNGTIYCGKCASPLKPSKDVPVTETLETPKEELTTGSTFAGRYQIIEALGKGGMGKVYKVLDKKINEKIALKLIKPEIASDKKVIERFGYELKMARQISHRNVGRMYHLGEHKETHYITMEYVSGEDLKSFIRKSKQLTIGTALFIARQICEGLSEAHRLGVVHRDLKSSNIMIDDEGNARIMDFGIARSLKTRGITRSGIIIGTPEYMSPEQAETRGVDHRADIYSLGVILYEMVTGRLPFEGETALSIAMKHKSEIPTNPRELNTQIPEDLSRVILKCLEKEKEKRCQTAEELLSVLRNLEKGIPTSERLIPKRMPITSKELTVTLRFRKFWIPVLVVIFLVIAGVIIRRVLSKEEAIIFPQGKPSLAIMYFENNTGEERLDHWRKALSDLLIADLTQSKYINVIGGDRLYNILGSLNQLKAKSYSSNVLKEVAKQGRVGHILLGNYAKAGDTIRISAILQEASTGKILGSERVEGRGEESIFSMVDELTRRIKSSFKLSEEQIVKDIDREIGKITTSSPEAYKYYGEGLIYYKKGDNRQAIAFFEKAVAIDPEFAMAYRFMASAYDHLGYTSDWRKYLQKALELSDRVSDRERYQIQGDYYWLSGEKFFDKAIETYEKLIELYPDDWIGNRGLGTIYFTLEEWDKAIERLEVNFRNRIGAFQTYTRLSAAYRVQGLYDKSDEILEFYLDNFSDNANIHFFFALNDLCQGKYESALVEVDRALSLDPTSYRFYWMKGDIFLCKGALIEAEREYKKLLEKEALPAQFLGRVKIGAISLLQGKYNESIGQVRKGIELIKQIGSMARAGNLHLDLAHRYRSSQQPEKAIEECKKAWEITVENELLGLQKQVLFDKGLTYVELESLDEAQRTADELKKMIDESLNRKAIRYYHHLMGMIELERENYSKAIEYFKQATALLPAQHWETNNHALFLEPLAFACYKTGELESAREQYDRITSLTVGWLYYGDIYAKSFYMLGKIHEQIGNKPKAIEYYDKFLDLWKDADPGIAEVEDARKRLAGLKNM